MRNVLTGFGGRFQVRQVTGYEGEACRAISDTFCLLDGGVGGLGIAAGEENAGSAVRGKLTDDFLPEAGSA